MRKSRTDYDKEKREVMDCAMLDLFLHSIGDPEGRSLEQLTNEEVSLLNDLYGSESWQDVWKQ
jgi:hypothetical protein